MVMSCHSKLQHTLKTGEEDHKPSEMIESLNILNRKFTVTSNYKKRVLNEKSTECITAVFTFNLMPHIVVVVFFLKSVCLMSKIMSDSFLTGWTQLTLLCSSVLLVAIFQDGVFHLMWAEMARDDTSRVKVEIRMYKSGMLWMIIKKWWKKIESLHHLSILV